MQANSKNGRDRTEHANVIESKRKRQLLSKSLTEVEVWSRNTLPFPLADGHMGFYDAPWMKDFDKLLVEVEAQSKTLTEREAERIYVERFMSLFGQTSGIGSNYKILPNASLSIDVLMTLAKRREWKMQLIDPCFDNLYLYAAERKVPVEPLHEFQLRQHGADVVDTSHDLIVLISPNNPTGWCIPEDHFRAIARKCARDRTTLALDCSFRAYDTTGYDHYAILQEEGTSHVVIEDTGKTLPTRERKTSIIVCSNDLKHDINEICEIHVLGWSVPVMLLCERLFARIEQIGLKDALHVPTFERRQQVRRAVSGTFLRPAPEATDSTLPVEWLEITDDRYSDDELNAYLSKHYGIGLLPGHHFFWSSSVCINRFVRLTLLKDTHTFKRSMSVLREAILNIGN